MKVRRYRKRREESEEQCHTNFYFLTAARVTGAWYVNASIAFAKFSSFDSLIFPFPWLVVSSVRNTNLWLKESNEENAGDLTSISWNIPTIYVCNRQNRTILTLPSLVVIDLTFRNSIINYGNLQSDRIRSSLHFLRFTWFDDEHIMISCMSNRKLVQNKDSFIDVVFLTCIK